MQLTPFENEIVDSLLWQIEGYKKGHVSERATNRVLRASLRRIKARHPAYSVCSKNISFSIKDHAVPVKIIIRILMEAPKLTKQFVLKTLDKFYISVTITTSEHVAVLKRLGLESEMPQDWNGYDPFARYKAAGIEIVEIE